MTTVVAVDFGASSVRVCRVELTPAPRLEVVHRHEHAPVAGSATLRWDWDRLVAEMHRGLERALEAGPVASIGIDTWGVDYGLLDGRARLLEPPVSYRDARTAGYRALAERIGTRRLYEIAGLQLMPVNTIFQLASHDPDVMSRAARVLMLPELLVHELTGVVTAETTSAGTTGLVDLATGTWSGELIDAIGLAPSLFPEIRPATAAVGRWRGVPVHLVGGHDTASAVAAGAVAGAAFVSAGTWLLVGRERATPDTSPEAEAENFANEQGALGGIRFLRNVAGWWILEEMRRAWGGPPVEDLLEDAVTVGSGVPVADLRDGRFLAPLDMVAEYREAARLDPGAERRVVVRSVVESMAATVAATVAHLGPTREVRVFGGGSRSELLLDRLGARTGLPVTAGPVEAAALGNALVQGVALGVYESLGDARASLAGALR